MPAITMQFALSLMFLFPFFCLGSSVAALHASTLHKPTSSGPSWQVSESWILDSLVSKGHAPARVDILPDGIKEEYFSIDETIWQAERSHLLRLFQSNNTAYSPFVREAFIANDVPRSSVDSATKLIMRDSLYHATCSASGTWAYSQTVGQVGNVVCGSFLYGVGQLGKRQVMTRTGYPGADGSKVRLVYSLLIAGIASTSSASCGSAFAMLVSLYCEANRGGVQGTDDQTRGGTIMTYVGGESDPDSTATLDITPA